MPSSCSTSILCRLARFNSYMNITVSLLLLFVPIESRFAAQAGGIHSPGNLIGQTRSADVFSAHILAKVPASRRIRRKLRRQSELCVALARVIYPDGIDVENLNSITIVIGRLSMHSARGKSLGSMLSCMDGIPMGII